MFPILASAGARLDLAALAGALDAQVGRFDESVTHLRAARRLLDQIGDDQPGLAALRFEVELALARCHIGVGQLADAVEAGREALAPRPGPGAVRQRRRAPGRGRVGGPDQPGPCARPPRRLGRGDRAARPGHRRRAALAPASAPRRRPARARLAAARSGDLDGVERFVAATARAEARACGEPLAEYCAGSVTAVASSARGDAPLAIRHYRTTLRLARALSLHRREMIEQANLALSLVDVGEHDEALQHMLSVRAICSELGDVASAADANVGLGRILRARGDLDEAIACF